MLAPAVHAQAVPAIQRRPLVFPRDHGAHPEFRTEWWYATGLLQTATGDEIGFQVTFFRSRGVSKQPESGTPGRFEPRQLLFAHAALSDVRTQRLWHAQAIARWNASPAARGAMAALNDTQVRLQGWELRRTDLGYHAQLGDAQAAMNLQLTPTQPLLLQGDQGYSRKGPDPTQASHYYSLPHLRVSGTVRRPQRQTETQAPAPETVTGTAWLDHEWSETLLHPEAVGWDWIGMNLHDGSALTAFRLRRADGSAVWAGGSWRANEQSTVHAFAANEVQWQPLSWWQSPLSNARYPVRWRVQMPVGVFEVLAKFEAQELDSRNSTGAIYWEGLSELRDPATQAVRGIGYLEMTGYAQRLHLG
jgi:predicted secreted hydrolase